MNEQVKILNFALKLSMEFGENFLQPINKRLNKKFPDLQEIELDNYNQTTKEINKIANEYVYLNSECDFLDFKKYLLNEFSWISDINLNRLFNQSKYFAIK